TRSDPFLDLVRRSRSFVLIILVFKAGVLTTSTTAKYGLVGPGMRGYFNVRTRPLDAVYHNRREPVADVRSFAKRQTAIRNVIAPRFRDGIHAFSAP
ncbi:MAG: hypothetical protein LC114_12460, partial [Bryobacterales bacterium]|nr:hypothetical protein [Bryobacterales bacterium]